MNARIADAAEALDGEDGTAFKFLCECDDSSCSRWLSLTVAEYRNAKPGSLVCHPL